MNYKKEPKTHAPETLTPELFIFETAAGKSSNGSHSALVTNHDQAFLENEGRASWEETSLCLALVLRVCPKKLASLTESILGHDPGQDHVFLTSQASTRVKAGSQTSRLSCSG